MKFTKSNNNQEKREFKIPEDAKKFAKITFKKFKKDNDDYYDSKKELKKAYYAQLIDLFPACIALVVKYGHLEQVKETKDAIYQKITDPEFLKYLKKEIKDDLEFDNIMLLPNVIYDILTEVKKQIEIEKANNPDSNVTFDVDDLMEISQLILKKSIKKMKKYGIDEAVAFDVLSVIPTPRILVKSQYYHIRQLFTVIYEHAKTKDINFDKLIDVLFKKDDEYIPSIITFALLERKEKIGNFTDTQKKVFNDITEYCFKTMEEMKKDEIQSIMKAYTDSRKRDESQNKDTNRRYYISSLPESDYPKILKVVENMCNANDSLKKYF